MRLDFNNLGGFNTNNNFSISSAIPSTIDISKVTELNTPTLGRFSGVFARLNSKSNNNRFYSSNFWMKVINSPRVQSDLKSGKMIGIFEHPTVKNIHKEDGDATIRHPQNGAFIVKNLTIVGNEVIGEAYLLNTPLGRLLGTYFLAKDKNGNPLIELSVSARGYSRDDYFDKSGTDQMNPNDYYLQTFDVVLNPGINGTRVKMESSNYDDYEKELLLKMESQSIRVANIYSETSTIKSSLISELGLVSF